MVRGVARKSRRLLHWIVPIVAALPILFYVGGVLLSLGAFAPGGGAGLGAFDLSELATAGWLNLGPTLLTLTAVWVVAATLVWPISELLTRGLVERAPRSSVFAAEIIGIALCAYAIASVDGVFQLLIAVFATLIIVALVAAQLTRSERMLQAQVRPLGWFLLCFSATITLIALGEAASPFGVSAPARAAALFVTPFGQRCVYPVLIGRARLLYVDGDRLFLSDYENRSVVQVGQVPTGVALRRHVPVCARLPPVAPAR
ncbi:hypothetical protein KZ820_21065 [Sphingomonas sp. RRHST34]|uniref:Uncharacterized protein n=1 Tax=Sphingomonas citri TaxID=2862499 RepID=A0ABS7BUG2_9SPHN|nr:hypothetical protein [Sphingomonas citri]MBW6533241.1 hypothetical protein [Sphingomonas citri]